MQSPNAQVWSEGDVAREETELRRRLLFRLLADFDFERPRFHYENVTDPLPATLARSTAGKLIFR